MKGKWLSFKAATTIESNLGTYKQAKQLYEPGSMELDESKTLDLTDNWTNTTVIFLPQLG